MTGKPAPAAGSAAFPDGVRIGSAAELGVPDEALAAFYRDLWPRPIALARADFIGWQMREAPRAQGRNASVVALRGDAVVAAMGATPATFRLDGAAVEGAELTTWITAPAARGLGLGRGILRYLQERYAMLMGAGITAAALPLYLGAGFSFLAHVPRFFHIADAALARRFTDSPEAALETTLRRQAGAGRAGRARACPAADLAPLAAAGLAGLAHFGRDAAGLAWRYDRHPVFRYEAFAATDTGAGMGVVLREDRIAGTPILHLVDLFGDPADAGAAIAFVEAAARGRGAAFVDFTGTAGVWGGLLRARGWSSAVDDPLVELPSLFHPVELRRPPTTSVVIWGREHRARLYDFARLHLTKGDLDLDRPTLAYLEGAAPC